jgi:hypothetical protein
MNADTETIPDDTVNAGASISLVIAAAAAAFALWPILSPPFTNEELRNFVDTWEPHVFAGLFFLAAYAFGALVAAIAALVCSALTQKIFGAASGVFVVAFLLQVISLNMLTAQAEEASGHVLHWSPLG